MKIKKQNSNEPRNSALNISDVMCSNIPKCNICNDTGKVKYLPIEFAMYSWQKYDTRDCRCKLIDD